MPCRYGFRMCLSHLIYTVRPCLIHTCHAMPMPFSDHAVLLKATAQYGRRESMATERHERGMGTAWARHVMFESAWTGTLNFVFNFFLFFLRISPLPPPQWARASSFMRFLDHTQRRTTVGRTPLDEWSAPVAETSTWQHTTLTTDRHRCPPPTSGIRTHTLSRRAAADLPLRMRGHWDRLI